jgi:hypothetical protein
MNLTKTSLLSAFAIVMIALAGPAAACDNGGTPPDCNPPPADPDPVGGNPGNGKPVGNSPWDGITGNSARNDNRPALSPRATPMDGQRDDANGSWIQPGDKGTDASNANK